MKMTPRDTSGAASLKVELVDEEMIQILSAKTGAERLAIAAGMFRSARSMISSHLRSEHPDWDEESIEHEVVRRLSHGTE